MRNLMSCNNTMPPADCRTRYCVNCTPALRKLVGEGEGETPKNRRNTPPSSNTSFGLFPTINVREEGVLTLNSVSLTSRPLISLLYGFYQNKVGSQGCRRAQGKNRRVRKRKVPGVTGYGRL